MNRFKPYYYYFKPYYVLFLLESIERAGETKMLHFYVYQPLY